MTDRSYPEEPADSFPRPPLSVTDREGRDIEVRTADASVFEDLVEMYVGFDPADRAQGIPPVGESRVRDWLGTILEADCLNVVAWHEGSPVGHAMLVPDSSGACELAVFVIDEFQNAGIGTHLLEALLGRGRAEGVERVWLTVERWNEAAISLYRKLGFETADAESFELEMAIRL